MGAVQFRNLSLLLFPAGITLPWIVECLSASRFLNLFVFANNKQTKDRLRSDLWAWGYHCLSPWRRSTRSVPPRRIALSEIRGLHPSVSVKHSLPSISVCQSGLSTGAGARSLYHPLQLLHLVHIAGSQSLVASLEMTFQPITSSTLFLTTRANAMMRRHLGFVCLRKFYQESESCNFLPVSYTHLTLPTKRIV